MVAVHHVITYIQYDSIDIFADYTYKRSKGLSFLSFSFTKVQKDVAIIHKSMLEPYA